MSNSQWHHDQAVGEAAMRQIDDEHQRLIAAAPDLIEALERVTDLLNDPGVGDHEQWKRDCKEWTFKARKALSRARGG